MIKDIIVNLSVTKEGSVVGKYAVSVAAALEAHLTGVAFIYDPVVPISGAGYIPAEVIETQRDDNESAAEAAIKNFTAATNQAGISADSMMTSASPAAAYQGRIGCHDSARQTTRSSASAAPVMNGEGDYTSRARSLLKLLAFSGFTLIVALAVLELLFVILLHSPRVVAAAGGPMRLLVQQIYRHFNRSLIQFDARCARYDAELFYTLKPGSCTWGNLEFSNEYRINRAGVRDDGVVFDSRAWLDDTTRIHDAFVQVSLG